MNKSTFAYRLNELLREKNITRSALALDVKISAQAVGNYINDTRKPDCEIVSRIAKVLNVSSDYLLGISDIKSVNADIRFIGEYTGLTQESISKLHCEKVVFDEKEKLFLEFISNLIMRDDINYLIEAIRKYKAFNETSKLLHIMETGDNSDIKISELYKFVSTNIFTKIIEEYKSGYSIVVEV